MAFLVALDQNKGLMGKNGLLPIPSYLSILRDHFMVRLQCCVNRHIVARYNIGEQYTPTLLMYAMHTVVYECKNSGLMYIFWILGSSKQQYYLHSCVSSANTAMVGTRGRYRCSPGLYCLCWSCSVGYTSDYWSRESCDIHHSLGTLSLSSEHRPALVCNCMYIQYTCI